MGNRGETSSASGRLRPEGVRGVEKDARNRREGGKRRGERRTREDGGNLSVTRRASGNERTPGNVYVLHKEGPPCVPLRSRARARALVPLAAPRRATPRHAAPRRATSFPLRPPPYVSNPSRTYDATRPMYNASQKSRVACLPAACQPLLACLPACVPLSLACMVCLPEPKLLR